MKLNLTSESSEVSIPDYSLVRLAGLLSTNLNRTATSRSLSELENEIKQQGLLLPQTYGKQELLDILGKASWERKHPGQPMPDFEQPMLIQSLKDKDPQEQEAIWESPNWAAEQKRNGVRCLVYLGASPKAHSRNISVIDYLPEGLNRQLPWLLVPMPSLEGTTLDGELISVKKEVDTRPYTRGKGTITNNVLQAVTSLLSVERSVEAQEGHGMPLRFVIYDILKYKGQNIKNQPYKVRREYLTEVSVSVQIHLRDPNHVILNSSITTGKRKFYEDCIQRGEEGCVLKSLEGVYQGGQTRTPDQLKVKREIEVDGVVIDVLPPNSGKFKKEGLLGGLVFGCKDVTSGLWYRVGAVSNVELKFRRDWSIQDENGNFAGIKPGLIGTVWEIQGHDWTKNIQLAHARIIRPRNEGPDAKSVDEAQFDVQAVIREQMSREGGDGSQPTPVPVEPPPNAAVVNTQFLSPSKIIETPVSLEPNPPLNLPPKSRKDKIWTHLDGSKEAVTMVRRGDRNSRVRTSTGEEKVVPNTELS